jgi:hypothetical protein
MFASHGEHVNQIFEVSFATLVLTYLAGLSIDGFYIPATIALLLEQPWRRSDRD